MNSMVGILSQCVHISNHHMVHFKYITVLFELQLKKAEKKKYSILHYCTITKKATISLLIVYKVIYLRHCLLLEFYFLNIPNDMFRYRYAFINLLWTLECFLSLRNYASYQFREILSYFFECCLCSSLSLCNSH